ncbi:hypothetical protein ABBQ38_007440 [Trebouxia sp. C0009 RCD-2024]
MRRRLDVSLGSAAGLSASAGRSSTLLGRASLSSDRRLLAGSGRKFLFADKEDSPSATGKAPSEAEVASLPWGPRVLQRSMRHLPFSGLPAPAPQETISGAGNVLPKGRLPPAAGGRPTAVAPKVQHDTAEVTVVMAAQQAALPETAPAPMGPPAGADPPVTPLVEGDSMSPPWSPCALQLRIGQVPFWGLPASPSPAVSKLGDDHEALPAASPAPQASPTGSAPGDATPPMTEAPSAHAPAASAAQAQHVALSGSAPAAYPPPPTGPGKTCSVRRRLDISLGSAAGLSASAGRSSTLLGRALFSSGRRLLAGSSRKFLFADKEHSPSATGQAPTEAEVASLPWGPRVLQRSMRHLPFSGLPAPAPQRTGSDAGSVLPKGTTPPAAGGRPTAVTPKVQPEAAQVPMVMAAQQVAPPAGPGPAPLPKSLVRPSPLDRFSSRTAAGRMPPTSSSNDAVSSGTTPARTAVFVDATPPAAQQTIGASAQKAATHAASASTVQAPVADAAARRLPACVTTTASNAATRLTSNVSVSGSSQSTAARKVAVSHGDAAAANPSVSGAGAARSRGCKGCTASAAARIEARSQAAAQKHVLRLRIKKTHKALW